MILTLTFQTLAAPECAQLSSTVAGTVTSIEPTTSSATEAPSRKGRSRRQVTSRFKGWDEDVASEFTPVSTPPIEAQPAAQTQEFGMFVSQGQEMVVDEATQQQAVGAPKKRRLSPAENDPVKDLMDMLAPAATRLKRQRLEEKAEDQLRGNTTPPKVVKNIPKAPLITKLRTRKKDIDVVEVARIQREKEEAVAKAEREALQESLDGMDIHSIRNLAIVEDMEFKRSAPPQRAQAYGDESERWNDKWNGRKNFKKFRKRGIDAVGNRSVEKVIVALEEVKKKDFGIGDEYWLEGSKESGRKRDKARDIQPTIESDLQATSSNQSREQGITAEEDGDSIELNLASEASLLHSTRSQAEIDKRPTSRNKRLTDVLLSKSAPFKNPRQTVTRPSVEDDDSDDDELKFRFKRKKN
jgi:nijmegen breakage syndrome protein 1